MPELDVAPEFDEVDLAKAVPREGVCGGGPPQIVPASLEPTLQPGVMRMRHTQKRPMVTESEFPCALFAPNAALAALPKEVRIERGATLHFCGNCKFFMAVPTIDELKELAAKTGMSVEDLLKQATIGETQRVKLD